MAPLPTLAPLLDQPQTIEHGLLGSLEAAFDQRRSLGRAHGKFAHFIGNDRESTPGIAGTRRFDAGVERQQIGLLADLLDDLDEPPRPSISLTAAPCMISMS